MAWAEQDAKTGRFIKSHGLTETHVWNIWKCMRARCADPRRYGGKGITVCKRWQKSFDAFFADMGFPPTPEHQIERIDNAKGYSKKNCRWATRVEQARNRSSNVFVTHKGQSKTIAEWAEITGINRHALYMRVRYGYQPPKLFAPLRKHTRHRRSAVGQVFAG